MAFVPRGPLQPDGTHVALELERPFHRDEIYNLLFSANKAVRAHSCLDTTDCHMCTLFNAQLEACTGLDDSFIPPPLHKPHITVGSAAGPDGLRPELLRWSLGTGASSLPDRLRLCDILATAYSSSITTGIAPQLSTENMTVPLFKQPKVGHAADEADPLSYRFITIGNVLHKIFELAITARIHHWASKHMMNGPEQVGFVSGHSTEDHVFTLLESIKYEWRHNRPVHALFIDLRRAFDAVNHEALFAVLTHMGFPPKLMALIKDWFSRRTTSVRVNGTDSDPVAMAAGVGQGSVLSPLLFILFLESLNRTLLADPRLDGVSIAIPGHDTLRILDLFYADDIVILAPSAAQLSIALSVVADWCTAWQMEIGTGRSKTEAVAFVPPALRVADAPLPAALVHGSVTVHYSTSYKYLGLLITDNLDLSAHETNILSTMRSNFSRYVAGIDAVREGPGILTRQMFLTYVASSSSYLLGVLDASSDFIASADAITLKAALLILPGANHQTPHSALWSLSGLLPLYATILGQRARLHLQFTDPNRATSIAAQLHDLLVAENAPLSWSSTSAALFADSQMGFPLPDATLPRNEITRRYGQHAASLRWSSESAHTYGILGLRKPLPALSRSVDTIPHGGPVVTALAASANGYHLDVLGPRSRHLPGTILPGVGALLSQGSDSSLPRQYRVALLFLLEGRRGFFSDYAPASLRDSLPPVDLTAAPRLPPKCGLCRLPGHNRSSCPNPATNLRCNTCKLPGHDTLVCTNGPPLPNPHAAYDKAWGRLVNGSSRCPLCDIDEPLGPAHLLVRCTNAAIVSRRAVIIAELPVFVGNLVTRLSRARSWRPLITATPPSRPADPVNWPPSAAAASASAAAVASWSTGHGAYLLFHALTATPWSVSSLVDSPPALHDGVARTIAIEFDLSRVPVHRWRSLTNWWLRWAGSRAHALLLLWQSEVNALDALNAAPPAAP